MSQHDAYLIPAVYVLVSDEKKVLLLRRKNTGYHDGDLTLPSGHVESNESIVSAAERELLEETGLVVNESDLKLVHVMKRPVENGKYYIDFYFLATNWNGKAFNKEPEKSAEIKWESPTLLKPEIIDHVFMALENIVNDIMVSEVQ